MAALLLLFLLTAVCSFPSTGDIKPTVNLTLIQTTTRYIKLVMQWGPSVCTNKKSRCKRGARPPDRFTIHGLWEPNGYNKKCETEKTGNGIAALKNRLGQQWPNVEQRESYHDIFFWLHEWNTHGCKLGLEMGAYFVLALDLAMQLGDLKRDLIKAPECHPDPVNGGYRCSPLAMSAAYHSTHADRRPGIRCAKDKNNNYQIQEVVFNISSTGTFQNMRGPILEGCSAFGDALVPRP